MPLHRQYSYGGYLFLFFFARYFWVLGDECIQSIQSLWCMRMLYLIEKCAQYPQYTNFIVIQWAHILFCIHICRLKQYSSANLHNQSVFAETWKFAENNQLLVGVVQCGETYIWIAFCNGCRWGEGMDMRMIMKMPISVPSCSGKDSSMTHKTDTISYMSIHSPNHNIQ